MARRKRVRTDFTGYSPTEDDLLEWELELARMSGTREQEDSPEAVALPTPAVEEDSASTPYPSLSDIVLSTTSAMPGPLGTIATGIRGAELLGETPTAEYAHEQFRAGWATRRAQALDARAEGMGLATSPETRLALDAITAPFKTIRTLEESFLPEEYLSTRDAAAAQEQRAIAEESGARAQELEPQIGGQYSARATLARSTAGLMTQPEIILPTLGAIAGGVIGRSPAAGAVGAGIASIPMAQSAYNAAIDEAKEWEGITDDERHEYGMMIAAAELGPDAAFGVLGAGLAGVFSKYGPKRIAKDAIEEAVRRRVGLRVTGAVAGGAFTENVAEDAGLAVRDWLSESDRVASEDARSAIAQQVAAERAEGWRRRIDPTAAGGLMGGTIGGPTIGLSAAAQAARDEVVSERDMLRNAMDAGRRGDAERASIESLFSAVERERNFDTRDAMYEEDAALARQRAEEDGWGTPDPQRVEDEMEAGFREMERQRQAEDLSALGPVTDTRPSITPETIAAERQAELEAQQQQERQAEEARLEQERQAREAEAAAERARQEQQVAARREALRKQQTAEERKQRRQQNTVRQRVMDQVIAENPDATDAEVLSITEQRINDPAFELEQEVSQVRTREEASQRAQETKRRREAIKAARRANPEASDREIARQLNAGRQEGEAEVSVADVQATKQPQPQERTTPIPENAPVQQKINTLAEDMGINLGMSPTSVDASTPSYQGTYLDKARKFLRGLVDMDTTGSVAVQNLIRQGKVLIVPNPQFANMPASNNVAEFSPETGEMFIYTDRMDDNPNAAKEIVKAVHESGHFLQQGSREGRSATLSSIFGSDGHTLIRNAADSGDARARRAVARAQELFPDNETVQNLEIPAYFYNEVMEDGSGLTGRLRNFIPNTVGHTRNLLRDRLGVDLEISANDIAAAVDDVLNEAVATDIQPQGIGASLDNLGMVVGERYSRFAEAEREVPSYEGARDGLLRTEISDADVEVMPLEQMVALNDERKANEGQISTTLNDILPHTALFSGYENVEGFNAMATMPVHFTSIPTASGFYSSPLTSRDMGGPREESITIDSALLHVASVIPQAPSLDPNYKGLTNEEVLRRILLHETQHAVQAREGFVPGANTESFIRRSTVRSRDRAAQRLQEMAEGLDLTRAEESLPLTISGLWQNEKRAAALITPEAEAKLFLDQGYPLDSSDRLIRRYGDRYREAQIENAEAQQAYQEERNRAFETYQRDYGETEARNTEARSRRITEELAEAPAETTMADAPGNIPVERTLDTAQYTGGVRQPPASESTTPNLGMEDRGTRQLDAQIRELENNARGRELTPFEQRRIEDLRRQSTELKYDNIADWRTNAPVPTSFDGSPTANAAVANQPYDGTYPLTPGTAVVITNRNSPGGRTVARVTAVANANPDRSSPPAYVYGLSFERDGITRTRQNVPSSQIREVVADTSDVVNLGMAEVSDIVSTVNDIANDPMLPAEGRELANTLAPLMEKLDVKTGRAQDNPWPWTGGLYDSDTNTIYINPDRIPAEALNEVILHEGLHSVTSRLLDYTGDYIPGVASLQRDFASLTSFLADHVNQNRSSVPPRVLEILTETPNAPVRNPKELLTYGITNPEVRRYLESVPAPPNTRQPSLFDRIKVLIGRVLGRSPEARSFISELLSANDRLLSYVDRKGMPDSSTPSGPGRASTDPRSMEERIFGNLGMAAVDEAAVDYSPTDSDAFRDWFGNSQMVDADGNPQVVYHGSTHEFNTFRPNDLGLIFVSPDRRFAEAFAGMDTGGFQRDAIPLYVRAENVWDFVNPEHRQQLLDNEGIREQMEEFIAGEMQEYGEVFGTEAESWGTPEQLLSNGDWSLIELPGVAQAIRDAGFDALTVGEAGNKNTAVFGPNQLKHATDNKGTWSRQDDSILGMADPETKDRQPNSRRVLDVPARTWLRALFDPAIGTGRQALAIIENAAAAPSDTMLLAEKYAAEYDDALGRVAAERNTTPSELNGEIVKKLDAISDREDSYDANLEAFHNVTKDYGKAGEALNKLRDKVDQLSLDMLAHRAEQARAGRALTPGEKARYTTIANNLGRYAHRMYAAGLGSQGKKWGKSVWNDWKKGENAHNYHLVENAVKHLVDNDLYIPDASEMAGVKTDQLRRLVQTWNLGNPEAMSKADMQDALLNARDLINGDSGRMDAMAQSIVQEMLGLTDQTSPITNYYRGGKLNDAILKERKNIPAPLRELLGEISHPAGRLMVTAGKQAEFVARSKMLMELRQASESDPVMQRHIQPPNAIGTPAAEGMSVLQGDSYGPLEGYLVSPNMKSMLGDTIQQLATFEQATGMAAQRPGVLTDNTVRNFLGKYGTVARTEKAIKIIGNPANFLWNFAGAPDMLLKNGNLDPRIAAKAMVTASEIIRTTRNPKQATAQSRRVQRAGVTDSAFIGEINKAQWRKLEGIMKEMEGKSPLQVWNKLRAGGAAAVETYAMMDVWSKIANFYHQADSVLPAFYKAEGIERTQEQLDREAAEIVNRTNISYKRAAPLIKAIEQSGLTQFGTYFYETFRVEVTNAMQGIEELNRSRHATTPEGRNIMAMQGAKRLTGQLTSWGLKYYLGRLASEWAFGDDEEERRDTRSLFPDYLQNQDFVPMGFTDMPVGNRTMRVPVFMNASRIDPTGPSSDIMRSMLHEDASPSKIWEDIVDLYIAPRIVGQSIDAMKATFGDERITRTPLMEQVGVPGYSYVSNTFGANKTRAWANVVETFLPGITTAYRDTNEIPDAEDPTSAIAFALTRAGATMYIQDPSRAASRVSYEYGSTVTTLRREVADYFDTNPNGVDEEHLLGRLTSMQDREREAFEEVARVYRGALNTGLRPREISTILKENRVPDEVISQLRRDRFESRFISKASIDRYAQNEMNKGNKTREEKREIRRKWDEAWRMLRRQQRNLRRNDG